MGLGLLAEGGAGETEAKPSAGVERLPRGELFPERESQSGVAAVGFGLGALFEVFREVAHGGGAIEVEQGGAGLVQLEQGSGCDEIGLWSIGLQFEEGLELFESRYEFPGGVEGEADVVAEHGLAGVLPGEFGIEAGGIVVTALLHGETGGFWLGDPGCEEEEPSYLHWFSMRRAGALRAVTTMSGQPSRLKSATASQRNMRAGVLRLEAGVKLVPR